jgi:hypothetical protein
MKKITSNPNKPVEKYIEHGEIIMLQDEAARRENAPWALLDNMKGAILIRLSALKNKTYRLNALKNPSIN